MIRIVLVLTIVSMLFIGLVLAEGPECECITLPPDFTHDETVSGTYRGNARTVELIYFVPRGNSFHWNIPFFMQDEVEEARENFSRQLGMKFSYAKMDNGYYAHIHLVHGVHEDGYYIHNTFTKVKEELRQQFDLGKNVYVVVPDISSGRVGTSLGTAQVIGQNGGVAMVGTSALNRHIFQHELGHSFGLPHDFSSPDNVMAYGSGLLLTRNDRRHLRHHRYFDPSILDHDSGRSVVSVLSDTYAPFGEKLIKLKMKIDDPDGVHHAWVSLLEDRGRSSLKYLDEQSYRESEFEMTPYPAHPGVEEFEIRTIDLKGNWSSVTIDFQFFDGQLVDVEIPDKNFEIALRDATGKSEGILNNIDLGRVQLLSAVNAGIRDLTGLEYCENLFLLSLDGNPIEDFTPAFNLPKIEVLYLPETGFTVPSKPFEMRGLRALSLTANGLRNPFPFLHTPGLFAENATVYLYENPLDFRTMNVEIPELQKRGIKVGYEAYKGPTFDFTFSLKKGQNLVSLPMRISDIERVSDLFTVLGGDDFVDLIITLNPKGEWATYSGMHHTDTKVDAFIVPGMGVVIYASRSFQIKMTGEGLGMGRFGHYNFSLRDGKNFVGVPVRSDKLRTVGDFFTFSSMKVVSVIAQDGKDIITSKEEGEAIPIKGGEAYFIDATVGGEVSLFGAPWDGSVIEPDLGTPIGAPPAHLFTKSVLGQNFPNPSNPETWIPYELREGASVIVRIYTVDGTLVRTLSLGWRDAGRYISRDRATYWDGRNETGESVASGVYFYNISAGEFTATRRMVIGR